MSTVFERISLALNVLLNSNAAFTILDVTNVVNADGEDEVRHHEVRKLVKPFLNNIVVGRGYVVTLIDVTDKNGNMVQAACYHPIGVDSSTYGNRQNVTKYASSQAASTAVAPSPVSTCPKAAKTSSVGLANARSAKVVKVRSDGAVCIPKALLVEAGLYGDDVEIVCHPNSLGIIVGKGNRLVRKEEFRVSKRDLEKSNLGGLKIVTVSAFSDKVVISK
jgi:hypothetical protein